MAFNRALFVVVGQWASLLFYLGCMFPQIWENYRIKSARGLSCLSLLLSINSFIAAYIYIIAFSLPPAYKIIAPLQAIATAICIGQQFYYDKNRGVYPSCLPFIYVVNA